MLNAAAGAVWRLARSLPDEPLRQYQKRLREPPSATEVERLRKERIGQDVFREALMLFWDGACAVLPASATPGSSAPATSSPGRIAKPTPSV